MHTLFVHRSYKTCRNCELGQPFGRFDVEGFSVLTRANLALVRLGIAPRLHRQRFPASDIYCQRLKLRL